MWRSLAALAALLLIPACCGADDRPPGTPDGGDPRLDVSASRAAFGHAGALPTGGTPAKTKIEVVNGTAATIVLDLTWGDNAAFGAVALDRHLGMLGFHDGFYCDSECDGENECIECEEPMDRLITLAPGESHIADWGGELKRYGPIGDHLCSCFDRFTPAPGRYLITAAVQGGSTAGVEVQLPSTEPIRIEFGRDDLTADSCEGQQAATRRAAMNALDRMLVRHIVSDRIESCDPAAVRCVIGDKDLAFTAEPGGCEIITRMQGDSIETTVHLPLPQGHVGGENYITTFDAAGTTIRMVKYEQ